jgi:NAD(P)-dependent dehydrogenase (short-subunit alcohol dehydrogenase family)
MRLEGKIALVTGAASGIGRAVAGRFVAEGARVALIDRNAILLTQAASELAAAGRAWGFAADVTDPDAAAQVVAEVRATWGVPDVLVTSAAISKGGTLTATPAESWDRVFEVNVRGVYLWCRAVLPAMVEAGRGSIITVASQLALAGGRGNAAYLASKGAVMSLTRSIALDYAEHGVRANCLVPGAIETPFLEASFARQPDPTTARERSRARHPLGRFGRPAEVAAAALFLASDESSFTTGALLAVDGGWLVG